MRRPGHLRAALAIALASTLASTATVAVTVGSAQPAGGQVTPAVPAVLALPAPSDWSGWLNWYRQLGGAPEGGGGSAQLAVRTAARDAGPQNHVNYLAGIATQGSTYCGHDSDPAFPRPAGDYTHNVLFCGPADVATAMLGWASTPFHGQYVLDAGRQEFGAGANGTRYALQVSPRSTTSTLVWPRHNGLLPFTSFWRGGENPDPRALCPSTVGGPAGATVMAWFPGNRRFEAASITTVAGVQVPMCTFTSDATLAATGTVTGAMLLFARQPLVAGTWYTASVVSRPVGGGEVSEIRWRFYAADRPAPPAAPARVFARQGAAVTVPMPTASGGYPVTGGTLRLTAVTGGGSGGGGSGSGGGTVAVPVAANGRTVFNAPAGWYSGCLELTNALGTGSCVFGDGVEILAPAAVTPTTFTVNADDVERSLELPGTFDGPGSSSTGWQISGGDGVAITAVTSIGDTRLSFRVRVAAGTVAGARDLVITGPDGQQARCTGCLVVRAAGTTTPTIVPFSGGGTVPAGYRMLRDNGQVYGFGAASSDSGAGLGPAVAIAPGPGRAFWVLRSDGVVVARDGVAHHGNVNLQSLASGERVTTMAGLPDGRGYWVFTNRGRAIAFGGAVHHGDMREVRLNGPVVAAVATTSGRGYWMIGSDGGVFSFGDARFHGSMGGQRLNAPVVGIVPDQDGTGYWLVAADGGIFAFDATFRGSIPGVLRRGQVLNRPVIGAVGYGTGYLMVASDGGVFDFSGQPAFYGSLGSTPPPTPIVGVAPMA